MAVNVFHKSNLAYSSVRPSQYNLVTIYCTCVSRITWWSLCAQSKLSGVTYAEFVISIASTSSSYSSWCWDDGDHHASLSDLCCTTRASPFPA